MVLIFPKSNITLSIITVLRDRGHSDWLCVVLVLVAVVVLVLVVLAGLDRDSCGFC